jgi:2-amino-4-hydroxy-6-hydroxymethyldihydropteridine diphosphokinase
MAIEIVLIGSNVDRERCVARVLQALLDLSGSVHVSRIVETPPIGLVDGGSAFLNLAAALPWNDETAALKKQLIAIEVALGRDRGDRRSSVKSRTADIDPVLRLESASTHVKPDSLPTEPYAREVLLEVLAHIGVRVEERPATALPAVEIPWGDMRLGRVPATLTRPVRHAPA